MKYEFKPFYLPDYLIDIEEGWLPTYRTAEQGACPAREVRVIPLGKEANSDSQLASVDCENGSVYVHNLNGRFDPKRGETCLDVILYREVPEKPAEVTIHGYALVNDAGKVFCVQPYEIHGGSDGYKPVPCTITLHEQN